MKKYLMLFILFIGALDAKTIQTIKEEFLSQNSGNFDCHSSCIIETTPGNLCVAYKGGPGQGHSNTHMNKEVGIWITVFDGISWSPPEEIIKNPHSVAWTPVLCKNREGELLLFYRIGPDPRNTVSFLKRSSDNGKCWSSEELLPAGIIGPTKNKPIVDNQGGMIFPSSWEVGHPNDQHKATACWIEISDSECINWKKIGPLQIPNRKFGAIEPALFYDRDGFLRMICRDRANKISEKGYLWMSTSKDNGQTWSTLEKTKLPNPDSAIDIVDLGSGVVILLYNHSHENRYPLNLAFSKDGGETWSNPFILDKIGEFPSGYLGSDGLLHITYAIPYGQNNQRRIKYVQINPKQYYDPKF